MHHAVGPSVLSNSLTIQESAGKMLTLNAGEILALPHKTIVVVNGHSKASETYSGVQLSALLAKAGVPQGENVRGALFMNGIVAEGTDGYRVLYSVGEIDPALHTGDVLVADAMNGKPLTTDGVSSLFRLKINVPLDGSEI